MGQTTRAQEADPPSLAVLPQQADDALGQVPAPHVHVLVQVVTIHIGDSYLVPMVFNLSVYWQVWGSSVLVQGEVLLLLQHLGGEVADVPHVVGVIVLGSSFTRARKCSF